MFRAPNERLMIFMSIRNIDFQIMVNRSAEGTRDAAALHKQGEIFQMRLNDSTKNMNALMRNTVNSIKKIDISRVNADGKNSAREQKYKKLYKSNKKTDLGEDEVHISADGINATLDIKI